VNLSKSVPVHTMNRTGVIAPVTPNLSTRWRSVVCFMPRPLYPQKKTPNIQQTGDRVGSRDSKGALQKINPMPLAGTKPRIFKCPAHSPVLILSMLSQLSIQD